MGLNAKTVLGEGKVFVPGELTNPVVAAWCTGYIRAVLSEQLFMVQKRGGRIISCTTDGYICDLNPESYNLLHPQVESVYGIQFGEFRKTLGHDGSILEVKGHSVGLAS